MKKQLFVVATCLSLAAAWAANGPKLNLVTGHDVELSVFREGAQLFCNRSYRAPKLPSLLDGQSLVVAPIDGFQIDCLTDGRLYALAPEVPYWKDTKVGESLVKNGFDGYVRPDHGRNIFGEDGKPGYGLYDRALGCAYINGLFEMAEKELKK
jgi:hypothetical protein